MKLIAHSFISSKGAFLNCTSIVACNETDENFLKYIYTELKSDYPKFYKMDYLSKMAFLADSLLHDMIPVDKDQENKLNLIMANATSSVKTDLKFIDSYSNLGNPSPSLFVYTLPNILNGELSIRHKWYGENSFFILESFDAKFFIDQIQFSFNRGNELCICGWIESPATGNEECFLFLVSNEGEALSPVSIMNILNGYRNE
jgi:hypothetical protein